MVKFVGWVERSETHHLPPTDESDGFRGALRHDNQYCMVWRIENGKIKEIEEYCDSALVERVLGEFPASKTPVAI
jgi:hypothetical protein